MPISFGFVRFISRLQIRLHTNVRNMRCAVLLILILVEIAYLIAGGYIFWTLEAEAEQQQKQQQRAFNLSYIIENLTGSCLTQS